VRRIAGYFNRCPDNLTAADLKTYFAWMVENYSWSSVKVDLWGSAPIRKEVRSGCCAQHQMNPTPSPRSRASGS
jgi:hypothetical protein